MNHLCGQMLSLISPGIFFCAAKDTAALWVLGWLSALLLQAIIREDNTEEIESSGKYSLPRTHIWVSNLDLEIKRLETKIMSS